MTHNHLTEPAQRGLAFYYACCVALNVGFGLFQTPNNRNMLLSAPRERSGAAGGMQATARLVGQTAGAVVISCVRRARSAICSPRWAEPWRGMQVRSSQPSSEEQEPRTAASRTRERRAA